MSNQKAFQRMQGEGEMLREIIQYGEEYTSKQINTDDLYDMIRHMSTRGRITFSEPVITYQSNHIINVTLTARGVTYSDIQPRRSSVDGE